MGAITIYAIKSAICLALLYLPYTLLMRRDTFHAFNRVLLLSIVVLSLVMPLFKPLSFLPQGEMISQPIKSLEEAINPLSIEEETDGGFSSIEVETEEVFSSLESLPVKGNQGGNLQVSIEEDSGQIPWPTILVLIYIIGVVVCIAWKAFQLVRLYRYIPSNCLWKDTIDGIQVYAHFDDVCPFSWMCSTSGHTSAFTIRGTTSLYPLLRCFSGSIPASGCSTIPCVKSTSTRQMPVC